MKLVFKLYRRSLRYKLIYIGIYKILLYLIIHIQFGHIHTFNLPSIFTCVTFLFVITAIWGFISTLRSICVNKQFIVWRTITVGICWCCRFNIECFRPLREKIKFFSLIFFNCWDAFKLEYSPNYILIFTISLGFECI